MPRRLLRDQLRANAQIVANIVDQHRFELGGDVRIPQDQRQNDESERNQEQFRSNAELQVPASSGLATNR
jgi:hypothetical protein